MNEDPTIHGIPFTAAQAKGLSAILEERLYQDHKWGARRRDVGVYLLLMEEHLAEARRHYANTDSDTGALDELRKICALGLAAMEQHGAVMRRRSDLNDVLTPGCNCTGHTKTDRFFHAPNCPYRLKLAEPKYVAP